MRKEREKTFSSMTVEALEGRSDEDEDAEGEVADDSSTFRRLALGGRNGTLKPKRETQARHLGQSAE